MSDWTDLQLSHSLAPVQAPDALWERISGAATPVQPRWRDAVRRFAPCAAAAAVFVLLVGTSALELRPPHPDFVANDPVAVQRCLAHPAGNTVQPRPALMTDTSCKTCHSL
jgi:hypothetical protein